jgi:hypothetical protein
LPPGIKLPAVFVFGQTSLRARAEVETEVKGTMPFRSPG